MARPTSEEALPLAGAAAFALRKDGAKLIRRLVAGKWETENVRRPAIISAYVRLRRTTNDEQMDADDIRLSNDEGMSERGRKRFVHFTAQRVPQCGMLTLPLVIKAEGATRKSQAQPGASSRS